MTQTIQLSIPFLREALWEAGETIPPLCITQNKSYQQMSQHVFKKKKPHTYPLTKCGPIFNGC